MVFSLKIKSTKIRKISILNIQSMQHDGMTSAIKRFQQQLYFGFSHINPDALEFPIPNRIIDRFPGLLFQLTPSIFARN